MLDEKIQGMTPTRFLMVTIFLFIYMGRELPSSLL